MKNKNILIIVVVLLVAAIFLLPKLSNQFVITGTETMARTSATSVNAGETIDVTYTVNSVSGKWAASIVDTLICPGYTNQEKRAVMISDESSIKVIQFVLPNQEGLTCTLTGNYQFGNQTIKTFPTQTITTKVSVAPITFSSFTSTITGKSFTGTLTWLGGASPYNIVVSNWGDSSSDTISSITTKSRVLSHTYTTAGTKTISFCINDNNALSTNYCGTKAITITQTCLTPADTNCDGVISRDELGIYIVKWINNEVSRDSLGTVIQGWAASS
jgi:hypothetical protein